MFFYTLLGVKAPPPVFRAAIEIGGHKSQPENIMINYILLVSRQGTETRPTILSRHLSRIRSENAWFQRQGQVTEMVHDDVTESQSQDRQRCDAARTCEAD